MQNILLLQGPMGPFFKLLQQRLQSQLQVNVLRVVFNAGDAFYAGNNNVIAYQGSQQDWSAWLSQLLRSKQIDQVLAYGDCRFYHKVAAELCEQQQRQFWAFEEGYLRPNFVTLERFGANAHSKTHYEQIVDWQVQPDLADEQPVNMAFKYLIVYSIIHYNLMNFGKKRFSLYQHHRQANPVKEALLKLKGLARFIGYKFKKAQHLRLINKQPFYLVPLQVFNDAQLKHHSPFASMSEFIETCVASFAQHAPANTQLVFKHHPMDRGECHYGELIKRLSQQYQLPDRLLYVHDLHLPSLLKACQGVVSINSTTVLGAFHHQAPVKILGEAFYNLKGLACELPLDQFWQNPTPVDKQLYLQLKDFLRHHNQFNGSFYSAKKMAVANVVDFLQQHADFKAPVKRSD